MNREVLSAMQKRVKEVVMALEECIACLHITECDRFTVAGNVLWLCPWCSDPLNCGMKLEKVEEDGEILSEAAEVRKAKWF